jgi:hypothetical protein
MAEQVMPGKGARRQGGQLERGHCERGGLEHRPVVGEIDLCQERGGCACREEEEEVVVVGVRLGYPHHRRLGEVSYTL